MAYKKTKRLWQIEGHIILLKNNAQYHKHVSFPKVNQKCNIILLTIGVRFLNYLC